MPSSMMSEAIAPVNLSPVWVLALSRVCVMRTGIVVPADRVMVCTTGVGGGDGGGGGAWAAAGAGIGCGAGSGVGANSAACVVEEDVMILRHIEKRHRLAVMLIGHRPKLKL